MLVKQKYVYDLMRDKELSNWKLKSGGKLINEGEYNSVDEATSALKRCLRNLYDGVVEVHLSKSKDEEKGNAGAAIRTGNYVLKVEIDGGDTSNSRGGVERVSGFDMGYQEKFEALRDQMVQMQMKQIEDTNARRMRALKRRLEENSQPDSWQEKAIQGLMDNPQGTISSIMQLVQLFKGMNTNGSQPMAGIGSVQVADTTNKIPEHDTVVSADTKLVEQQKIKCSQACGALLTIDTMAGDHLLILAELAQRDPATYAYALEMLNGQVETLRKKDEKKKGIDNSSVGDSSDSTSNTKRKRRTTSAVIAE